MGQVNLSVELEYFEDRLKRKAEGGFIESKCSVEQPKETDNNFGWREIAATAELVTVIWQPALSSGTAYSALLPQAQLKPRPTYTPFRDPLHAFQSMSISLLLPTLTPAKPQHT